jgi:hypothetical protein
MGKNALSSIGRKLSRLFLGRIVVRKVGEPHREEPPAIMTHFRSISTSPIRNVPRVGAALFVKWKSTRAITAGSLLGAQLTRHFHVNAVPLTRMEGVNVLRYEPRIKKRAAARSGMRRIRRSPQTRQNRLNYLKIQPKFEKASLLALYSPLFHDKVKKSVLDKSSGNLIFWYDDERVKLGDRYHLLLLRVFDGGEPLKWVWLPANKKIG